MKECVADRRTGLSDLDEPPWSAPLSGLHQHSWRMLCRVGAARARVDSRLRGVGHEDFLLAYHNARATTTPISHAHTNNNTVTHSSAP